jgi:hypothetical protein
MVRPSTDVQHAGEIERLTSEVSEWKERLRAVVERSNLAHDCAEATIGELQAENARLREHGVGMSAARLKVEALRHGDLASAVARRVASELELTADEAGIVAMIAWQVLLDDLLARTDADKRPQDGA